MTVATSGEGSDATTTVTRGSVSCTIAHLGATLLDFRLGGSAVIDGYWDIAELKAQDGVRSGVLAPFAGRVREARYTFEGTLHDLRPGEADRTVFHGFFRSALFALVKVEDCDGRTDLILRAERVTAPGYPYSVTTRVKFSVRSDGLDVEIGVRNDGPIPAPVTLGWHPYFELQTAARTDDLVMRIPSDRTLSMDDALLPNHDSEPTDVSGSALDFTRPRMIGPTELDTCYVGLRRNPENIAEIHICTPEEQLTIWQDTDVAYLYTGDRLSRGARRSIAIESLTDIPDAFNDPEGAKRISLLPGWTRTLRCGFRYLAN